MATVFTDTLTQDDAGPYDNQTVRARMTPLVNPSDSEQYRVRCRGHSAQSTIVSALYMYRGLLATPLTPDATPTSALFGGSSGSGEISGTTATTDWTNVSGSGISGAQNGTHEVVASIVYGGSGGKARVLVSGTGVAMHYKSGDQGNSMTGTGWTFGYLGSYLVDLIETQTVATATAVRRGGTVFGPGRVFSAMAKLAAPYIQTYTREILWQPSRYLETRPRLIFPGFRLP